MVGEEKDDVGVRKDDVGVRKDDVEIEKENLGVQFWNYKELLDFAKEENRFSTLIDVTELINKYVDVKYEILTDVVVDEIQSDFIKLGVHNFYVGTMIGFFEFDLKRISCKIEQAKARIGLRLKAENPKVTVAEMDKYGVLETIDLNKEYLKAFKLDRVAKMLYKSVQEIVNCLKKAVDRIMWEKQQTSDIELQSELPNRPYAGKEPADMTKYHESFDENSNESY